MKFQVRFVLDADDRQRGEREGDRQPAVDLADRGGQGHRRPPSVEVGGSGLEISDVVNAILDPVRSA